MQILNPNPMLIRLRLLRDKINSYSITPKGDLSLESKSNKNNKRTKNNAFIPLHEKFS